MALDKALTFFERSAKAYPNDFSARIILSNIYSLKNENERALSVLSAIRAETPNSDFGDYACFSLNLAGYFKESEKPYMQFRSYEEIAELIFDKKIRHKWDYDAVEEYLDAVVLMAVSAKWAPFSITELMEFYYLNDNYDDVGKTAEIITKNYPQSWWDARARVRKLDIAYTQINSRIKRYKELVNFMEYRKKSGFLQEQKNIDERLELGEEIRNSVKSFEENTLNLVQRYKNYKIARNQMFKAVQLHEDLYDVKEVIRMLSHLNSFLQEYPEGVRAHFDLGMYYFKNENYQMALQFFNDHLSHYPKSPQFAQAAFMVGKVFQMQNRTQDAMSSFKKVLALGDPVWEREAANSALELCKERLAVKEYEGALALLGDMRAAKFNESAMAEATFLEGSCFRDMAVRASGARSYEYSKMAIEVFRHLVERYPESLFATMAGASLHEIESGRLNNSILISRISTGFIAFLFIGYFALLGYSFMRSDDGFYYFIMSAQLALLILVTFLTASFKLFGKLWELLFG